MGSLMKAHHASNILAHIVKSVELRHFGYDGGENLLFLSTNPNAEGAEGVLLDGMFPYEIIIKPILPEDQTQYEPLIRSTFDNIPIGEYE